MTKRLPFIVIAIFILAVVTVYGVDRYIYRGVSFNPIPKLTKESFYGTRIQANPITRGIGGRFISEQAVIRITDPTMKFYNGESRNIDLVNSSRQDGKSYVYLNSRRTADDPHFKRSSNRWEDIPCFVVTIENPTGFIPTIGGRNFTPPPVTPQNTVIVAFVDATNGKILMEYQFSDTTGVQ